MFLIMLIRLSFLLAVFCSIISQIPSVLESSWSNPLKYSWIIPALLLLFNHPNRYFDRPIRWFLLFILCFGLYCGIFDAFSLNSYIRREFYNICISFLVFAVSYKFWKDYGGQKVLRMVVVSILISSFFLAFFLYAEYLQGSNVLSRVFAYNYGKNQASMIIFCSLLIGLLNLPFKKRWLSLLKYVLLVFLFYVVVLIRSRSTFVGVFYVIYYFVFKIHNKKLTYFTLIVTTVAVFLVITNPTLHHIIIDGILFAGRDAEDLNELSSGRVYKLSDTWDIFTQNMWFGNGNMYMDCMPVVVLAQYGIFGASVFFSFLMFLGFKVFSFDKRNDMYLTAYLLFAILILNSLFEAQPPFGPGIKCFMLWLMLGFSFANISNQKIKSESSSLLNKLGL